MKNLLIFLFFPFLSFCQIVTNVEGRLIQLNADMTWEYYIEPFENESKGDEMKRKQKDFDVEIDEVPIFPGCEIETDKKLCFQNNMMRHISENFKYPSLAEQNNIEGRVFIQFIVDKDGSIVKIRTRGPSPHLEAEAYRLAKLLPKMTPAKRDGKPVSIPFSIPIMFRL